MFISNLAIGQIEQNKYPQNYFREPLDLPPIISGNFGEIRSNHFHSGLDFKTNQREGYPIHAVADGFISGSATATFIGTNKPGSSTSNGWIKLILDGSTVYIPAWT